MSIVWTENTLREYIENQIPEGLKLDYKAAESLGKDNSKRTEITKDVSAFANSAGGILIYGIAEDRQAPHPRPPSGLDPVNQTQITPEWLDQVIHNISPRVDGIIIQIVPLSSGPNHVAYVVEIPQGSTAHMAADHCYHKRFNFRSVPMEDHEVRDVMARGQSPHIELRFKVNSTVFWFFRLVRLRMEACNTGSMYAKYVKCRFYLPPALSRRRFTPLRDDMETVDGTDYFVIEKDNQKRMTFHDEEGQNRFGTAWFDPILPTQSYTWWWTLSSKLTSSEVQSDEIILWEVSADHAPLQHGSIQLREIEFVPRTLNINDILKTLLIEKELELRLIAALGTAIAGIFGVFWLIRTFWR